MMKYLAAFLLCCMFDESSQAQHKIRQAEVPGKWTARFNMCGLADLQDGNISVGAEYSFHPDWSLTTDISYLIYSGYIQNAKSISGFILKPGVRYYRTKSHRRFYEAVVFYKRAGYRIDDWLGKDADNGVPAYDEYQSFVLRKRVAGINVQAGWQRNLSRNQLLRLEMIVGFGVRWRWLDVKDEPQSVYQFGGTMFTPRSDAYYVAASVPCALRLVYYIR